LVNFFYCKKIKYRILDLKLDVTIKDPITSPTTTPGKMFFIQIAIAMTIRNGTRESQV
jgi:hypothetical protein